MNKALTFLAAVSLLGSCSNPNLSELEKEVSDTDRAFSHYSAEQGMQAAFLEFAAPDVVLIKPNMYPLVGHEKLKEHYMGRSDFSFVLTWEPQFAKVAKSGELGYTYGYWKLTDKQNTDEFSVGTYATVWVKQPDGRWKFVLNLGNQGLGEK